MWGPIVTASNQDSSDASHHLALTLFLPLEKPNGWLCTYVRTLVNVGAAHETYIYAAYILCMFKATYVHRSVTVITMRHPSREVLRVIAGSAQLHDIFDKSRDADAARHMSASRELARPFKWGPGSDWSSGFRIEGRSGGARRCYRNTYGTILRTATAAPTLR